MRMPIKKYSPEYADKAAKLWAMGATYKMLAAVFNVSDRTFERWVAKYPDIKQKMGEQRTHVNMRVSGALLEQATGYHYIEQETVKLKDSNGAESVEVVEVRKYVKGVTSAAIFWLKNRQPESWTDKQELQVSGLDELLNKTFDTSRGLPSEDATTADFKEKYAH